MWRHWNKVLPYSGLFGGDVHPPRNAFNTINISIDLSLGPVIRDHWQGEVPDCCTLGAVPPYTRQDKCCIDYGTFEGVIFAFSPLKLSNQATNSMVQNLAEEMVTNCSSDQQLTSNIAAKFGLASCYWHIELALRFGDRLFGLKCFIVFLCHCRYMTGQ
jgi:hypothetical protein